MRRCKAFLSLVLALCLCAGGMSVFAAQEAWSEDYYRAYDYSGEMSDTMRDDLDAACLGFIKAHQLDMVLRAVTEESLNGMSGDEFAKALYDELGFGYGEGRDGFVWLYNTEEKRAEVFCFGAAEGRVPQDYLDKAREAIPPFAEEHGVYGALYMGLRYVESYLEDHPAGEDTPPAERGGEAVQIAGGMPAWYPADVQSFTFYHDADAPRVVDAADIFTDAEEERLERRLGEIRAELQRDLVIYTDVTDYGLGQHICAADFYDFNGYGCGDEYEGACLFIDMNPDDRGWWCACSGSDTKGLYTEEFANQIDDALYEYMASGAYAEGVEDWAENFRTLYLKGAPFAPDWYPDRGETLTPFHDAAAPRVVDEIGLLTDAEAAKLAEQAAAIAQKYGVDVAIHTMPSPWGMDYDEVCQVYYTHMGYGVGENYDGILLSVFKREGYYAASRITGFGSVNQKLTEVNYDRLWDTFKGNATEDHYYRGAEAWLRQVDHLLRTGRVARSTAYWVMIVLFALALGSIFGGVALGRARHKMAPPRVRTDADAYVDSGASSIRDLGRVFLYTTTSRRYDPRESNSSRSSGGGGGSHRSSYSSSYHGSSGRSHSGSGRHF